MTFRLDHIAIGVRSIPACVPMMERGLGTDRADGGPSPGFDWVQWAFANQARLELIKPTGAAGFLHRFIERHGVGVHHVTFKVPSLVDAAARARAAGYDVVGYDDRHPGWKECFLHPKQAQGIVVQLAETHPHSAANAGAPTGRGAQLLALRLLAASEEAARAQWERLLGGHCKRDAASGRLCFRWAESPIAVVVSTEPGSEPGPIAIDVSAPPAASSAQEIASLFGTCLEVP